MNERRISHYRMLDKLAAGGMGELFVAEDETLQRRVALKSIRSEFRLDRELQARFLREARVLSQLDHPGICRAFDYVSEPDADYIVLELIEGEDLRQVIRGGVDARRAMGLAQGITDALAAAHAAGVVHRDLKPANVMVTREGVAKVLDFGLSRVRPPSERAGAEPSAAAPERVKPAAAAPRVGESGTLIWDVPASKAGAESKASIDTGLLTRTGGLMGTLRYMSPEQARGEEVTSSSDMYSLGLVLQELFTGQPAMDPALSTDEVLVRSQQGLSDPVRGLDGDLTELLEQLKAHSPSVRPTAVETLRRLKWIQLKPQRRLQRALFAAVLLAAAAGATKYTLDLRAARARAQARTEAALGMIGTLFEKQIPVLEQVGRLEAIAAAADSVQAYFDRTPEDELTDPERTKLAGLLMMVGSLRDKQGRGDEALVSYEDALALLGDLAERNLRDSETVLALGAAHFYIGQHELQFTKPPNAAAALERFKAYLEQAQRNAQFDLDRARALRELSYARNAIAGALLAQGKPGEALEEIVAVVEVSRELCAEQPGDQQVLLDLADSLSWLASAQSDAGRREDALTSLEEELALRRDMHATDEDNAEARARLAYCLTFLAQLHLDEKRFVPAVETAGEASDLLDSLCRQDPDNADLRDRLNVAQKVFESAQDSQ